MYHFALLVCEAESRRVNVVEPSDAKGVAEINVLLTTTLLMVEAENHCRCIVNVLGSCSREGAAKN